MASLVTKIEASANKRVAVAGRLVLEDRKDRAPEKTGQLRKSGKVSQVRRFGTSFVITIEFTAPQAEWLEKGTKPHVIEAKGFGAMRFYSAVAGEVIQATIINHPGSKKHRGWFTNGLKPAWTRSLRQAGAIT